MKPIIRMTFVLAAGVLAFTGNTARAGSHEVTVTGARGTTFQRDVTRADVFQQSSGLFALALGNVGRATFGILANIDRA